MTSGRPLATGRRRPRIHGSRRRHSRQNPPRPRGLWYPRLLGLRLPQPLRLRPQAPHSGGSNAPDSQNPRRRLRHGRPIREDQLRSAQDYRGHGLARHAS